MAATNLQSACAPANAPTRRGVLGCLVIAPIAASPALAALPALPAGRWDALRARYDAAHDATERYNAAEYKPAHQAFEELTGPCPAMSFVAGTGANTRVIEVHPEEDYSGFSFFKRHREMQNAYRAWWARYQEAERRPSWQRVSNRMDRLWSLEDQAREALMAEPAPDASAAMFKVRLALLNDELWENEREALLVDAQRLAGAH